MKRTIIALALPLALSACGDSSEAKLDRCKAEMKAEIKQGLDLARQEADKQTKALLKPDNPMAKEAMKQLEKMTADIRKSMDAAEAKLDDELKKWQGATGLAECEKSVAFLRKKRGA